MKFRPNRHYTTIAIYALLVIIAALLFSQAIYNIDRLMNMGSALLRFIQPVVYGFVIAFLLNPMLRFYDNILLHKLSKGRMRAKARRAVGVLLTYITFLFLIYLFFRLIIPQLILSVEGLFDLVPSFIRILNDLYNKTIQNFDKIQILDQGVELDLLVTALRDRLVGSFEGLIEGAYEYVKELVPQLFSAGARFTNRVIKLLLGVIISIYFLFDREKLFAQAKKISNAVFSDRATALFEDIALDANRIFSGFITGKIIDSFIIGIICYIGMYFMKMPFAMLISVIIGVTNIIPYFGPFIGAIPSALIIVIVDPIKAIWFAVFILLLQQFDGNVLGPKILGDNTGLSALWVVFAIMLFSGLWGVTGMFVGVPVFALIYALSKRFISFLLRRKGKSTDTRDYASEQNPLIK